MVRDRYFGVSADLSYYSAPSLAPDWSDRALLVRCHTEVAALSDAVGQWLAVWGRETDNRSRARREHRISMPPVARSGRPGDVTEGVLTFSQMVRNELVDATLAGRLVA